MRLRRRRDGRFVSPEEQRNAENPQNHDDRSHQPDDPATGAIVSFLNLPEHLVIPPCGNRNDHNTKDNQAHPQGFRVKEIARRRYFRSQGQLELLQKDTETGDRKSKPDQGNRSPQPGKKSALICLMFSLAIDFGIFSHFWNLQSSL
jgi:hypothetical protein